jgi:hypothetical protein
MYFLKPDDPVHSRVRCRLNVVLGCEGSSSEWYGMSGDGSSSYGVYETGEYDVCHVRRFWIWVCQSMFSEEGSRSTHRRQALALLVQVSIRSPLVRSRHKDKLVPLLVNLVASALQMRSQGPLPLSVNGNLCFEDPYLLV